MSRDKPRSNLCVPLTTRAAAFSTRCNLSVVAFGTGGCSCTRQLGCLEFTIIPIFSAATSSSTLAIHLTPKEKLCQHDPTEIHGGVLVCWSLMALSAQMGYIMPWSFLSVRPELSTNYNTNIKCNTLFNLVFGR